ncbi:hypothetical protein GKQ77_28820 [Streptomyces sp. BG9H]|uniref:Uncharacterized protein n=1 Tax=Streptomyces anatolicus TaxID=2675858 RepID=A0ABS6YVS7_9ACTN|nr:hypothetical protein [Streptomyces anatolicus]
MSERATSAPQGPRKSSRASYARVPGRTAPVTSPVERPETWRSGTVSVNTALPSGELATSSVP